MLTIFYPLEVVGRGSETQLQVRKKRNVHHRFQFSTEDTRVHPQVTEQYLNN